MRAPVIYHETDIVFVGSYNSEKTKRSSIIYWFELCLLPGKGRKKNQIDFG